MKEKGLEICGAFPVLFLNMIIDILMFARVCWPQLIPSFYCLALQTIGLIILAFVLLSEYGSTGSGVVCLATLILFFAFGSDDAVYVFGQHTRELISAQNT